MVVVVSVIATTTTIFALVLCRLVACLQVLQCLLAVVVANVLLGT